MTLDNAALVLYVGETIGCALFCVLFGFRSLWWKSSMGQNMLAMMFVLAVLQISTLLRLVLAEEWFAKNAPVIRFWSFLALFIVVWWRVVILLKAQHEDAVAARQARQDFDDTDPGRETAAVD